MLFVCVSTAISCERIASLLRGLNTRWGEANIKAVCVVVEEHLPLSMCNSACCSAACHSYFCNIFIIKESASYINRVDRVVRDRLFYDLPVIHLFLNFLWLQHFNRCQHAPHKYCVRFILDPCPCASLLTLQHPLSQHVFIPLSASYSQSEKIFKRYWLCISNITSG